ncbi:pyridoxal phosphate-dependent aminotransferase [Methylomicrobium lacus]|uniref:pyridoxal phosphate-dependent aminotransferase n=1 Tax=Methylomicrobium lacus TaxID=136992 RepID=UPI0035A96832
MLRFIKFEILTTMNQFANYPLTNRARHLLKSQLGNVFEYNQCEDEIIDLRTFDSAFFRSLSSLPTLSLSAFGEYSGVQGIPALLSHISQMIGVANNGIQITSGASEGLHLVMQVLVELGTVVALPYPTFPAYWRLVEFCGGTCVNYHDVDDLLALFTQTEGAPNLVVVGWPENPTGRVIDLKKIEEILSKSNRHSTVLILDLTYPLTDLMDSNTREVLSRLEDRLVMVGSIGKLLFLPGLRLGFVATNLSNIFRAICELKRHSSFEPCYLSQNLALQLWSDKDYMASITKRMELLMHRHSLFRNAISEVGVCCKVIPNARGFYEFVEDSSILVNLGLIGVPGNIFSDQREAMRYCLAVGENRWENTLNRLTNHKII